MAIAPTRENPEVPAAIQSNSSVPSGGPFLRQRIVGLLDQAVFAFLVLFAIAIPHSIKGAERAWQIAFLLWLAKLLIARARPYWQPLCAPLLLYVICSAISTWLSPEPIMSWDRMKFVCLVLAGIVVAQNVRTLRQVRLLATLLLLSGLAAALFTGWQYSYGIGARVETIPETSQLSQAGLHPQDIVTSVGGHKCHSPEQFQQILKTLPPHTPVTVQYMQYMQTRPVSLTATADDFLQAGLGTAEFRLSPGRPFRAQGTLGHYIVFAEILMQLGCLAWALMIASGPGQATWKILYAVAFGGITAALFMTETRAAFAGLLLGTVLILVLLSRSNLKWIAVAGLVLALAAGLFWFEHSRGVHWSDRNDIGTHFRVLMWEDGMRLVREHPWFGVGMESVRVHWQEWNIRAFIQYRVQSHFHSTFLQIAVERGVPALLAWLWFCVAYAMLLVRLALRLRAASRLGCGIIAGILGAFLAFSFTGFFHYNLGEEAVAMLLFFYYGIAIAMERLYRDAATVNQVTS